MEEEKVEYEIVIADLATKTTIVKLANLTAANTVGDVKRKFFVSQPTYTVERQSFRSDPNGRILADNEILSEIGLEHGGRLFFKDLGNQIACNIVYLAQYSGPILLYLIFYLRPNCIYSVAGNPMILAAHVACLCWVLHFAKRIYETLLVHRFSRKTMPMMDFYKNMAFYWGFTLFVGYFINHPLFTPPMLGTIQVLLGLAGFIACEYGNYSIHVALRDLRPEGTTARKLPKPTSNPMTKLFDFVSCPHYTYEAGAWLSFTILSQSLAALIFTVGGFAQMAMWALDKHSNYRKEFNNYPRDRKAILPFVL